MAAGVRTSPRTWTIGEARFDSGDLEGALRAFDRALELAEAGSAVRLTESSTERLRVESLRAERQECRRELGLPDDEPGSAGAVDRKPPRTQELVIAWFPREEVEAALGRWPSLTEDLGDPDAYCGPSRAACVTSAPRPGACRVSPR